MGAAVELLERQRRGRDSRGQQAPADGTIARRAGDDADQQGGLDALGAPRPRVATRADHHGRGNRNGRRRTDKARLRPEEAAVLQSYPADFPFQGTNGRVFLQIGNAVPPLMGGAIIDEFLAPAALRAPEVVERAA
ncbi:DNA cytosine methyltransferase [Microbacterium enclense]|uniref:DNA cytosine methyltransferase n=1 Tax=Microbacterium enclense TaxID=993073 RepID=UPI0021A87666|nr:DNA cytosine methyltransferase [Microbacterium enclense]MCT2087344.1 DNA cytosine methyltransferase [Microbacterium enclense]